MSGPYRTIARRTADPLPEFVGTREISFKREWVREVFPEKGTVLRRDGIVVSIGTFAAAEIARQLGQA